MLAMLKNRKKYYALWKSKQTNPEAFKTSQESKQLEELEDSLPLSTILFLRSYAETLMNKENTEKLVFDKNDLAQLSSLTDMNTQVGNFASG